MLSFLLAFVHQRVRHFCISLTLKRGPHDVAQQRLLERLFVRSIQYRACGQCSRRKQQLKFHGNPNDHARSMRPTFYSMWLEGSARKTPAQQAPFAETAICLPHCLPQRDFLASFCKRKIQKVIAPSPQTENCTHSVSTKPPKADMCSATAHVC